MFSIQDLTQYEELSLFIDANDTNSRRALAPLLKHHYVLKNNIAGFAERLSPPSIMAGLGLLDHLKILNETPAFSEDIDCMVKATQGGHLQVVMYLLNKNISINNAYTALLEAAEGGHSEVFKALLTKPLFEERVNVDVFKRAVDKENEPIINQLLHYPTLLAFADENEEKYGQPYLRPFVTAKIAYLFTEKPHNLTTKDTMMYFYILRHLIRRRAVNDLPDIDLLLSMPAIRSIAHIEVSPGQPNELLRMAMGCVYEAVEERLLTITAVRDHAEQNNYYGDDKAKLRQTQRDQEVRYMAFILCGVFQSLYSFNPAQSDTKIQQVSGLFCQDICKRILSYILPNPFKKPFIEHKFYHNVGLFFEGRQKKENAVQQSSVTSFLSTKVIPNYDN